LPTLWLLSSIPNYIFIYTIVVIILLIFDSLIVLKIVNHGIPEEVVRKMENVSKEFFGLPESERLKNYSDDPSKTTRLSTSFNVKTEKVSNWRDFLRLHCHPLEDYILEWPSNPPSFRSNNKLQHILCKIRRKV